MREGASPPPAAPGEGLALWLLAALTGAFGGLLGVGITVAIDGLQRLAFGKSEGLLAAATAAPAWLRVAAPAAGGLGVALILRVTRRFDGPEAGAHGTRGTIEAARERGGRLSVGPVVLRELIPSVVAVGTGGSIGREGPVIRAGALIGSRLGVALLHARRVPVLVAAGAAAGMAAAYNAPVGSALFAAEVVLESFALETLAPVALASIVSTLVARALRGDRSVYAIPPVAFGARELPLVLALGGLLAVASVAFERGVRAGAPLFERSRVPRGVRPIVGMALVGVLGIAWPEVYGNGFDVVNAALHEKLVVGSLVLLPFVKVLATALALGSGCPGGLFTPALVVGGLLGAVLGRGFQAAGLATSPPGAWALVGMAAITAGTSQAPLSALVLVFELVGHPGGAFPALLLASAGAALGARALAPEHAGARRAPAPDAAADRPGDHGISPAVAPPA